jgi:hypothetical protein
MSSPQAWTPSCDIAGFNLIYGRDYRHNKIYLYSYVVATGLWGVNALVSAVLVFHMYYLDSRTATVFVTNNLLLLSRWSKGLAVGILEFLYLKDNFSSLERKAGQWREEERKKT